MPNRKIRVSVKSFGEYRAILSIEERKNGDLIICPARSDNYEIGTHNIQKKQEKFSVHVSPSSPGYTIRQSIELSNGKIGRAHQFFEKGGCDAHAVVYGTTCPNLNLDKYLLRENNNEEILLLHDRDISRCTMFYFVIISDNIINNLSNPNFDSVGTNFSIFSVWIYSGYFLLPPLHNANKITPMTSLPKWGDERRGDLAFPARISRSKTDIDHSIFRILLQLSDRIRTRHYEAATAENANDSILQYIDEQAARYIKYADLPPPH